MTEPANSKDILDAVSNLAKAVPIYQDAIQPAAKEVGKGLQTIARTVNLALEPFNGLVWGYDQIKEFISAKLAEKLKDTPQENISPPKASIAGPLLESLRYIGSESSLSELYANLLATAMDKSTAPEAHPAFVELIRQMTSDEAKIMELFLSRDAYPLISIRAELKNQSGGYDHTVLINDLGESAQCERPEMSPFYIDNLRRLGLVELPSSYFLHDEGGFNKLESSAETNEILENIKLNPELNPRIIRGGVKLSPLGHLFIKACIKTK